MPKEGVKLLDMWASPFGMRAKIALLEKGVDYETQEEDLFGGKSDLLLSSNPIYQKVPVLLHDGKPMVESSNIVAYIDEVWPNPPLMPACAYDRARARFWTHYIDDKLFSGGRDIWLSKGGEELEVAKKEFIEILKVLEGALSDKDYFGGDSFGYVDIMTIPIASWFPASEKYGNFKVEDHCPKISAWIKRCMEVDSVAKIVPEGEKICGCVAYIRKLNGVAEE
ncbi:Glutathione transferase [Heracleum sosnowskyi]|uniref:glutathione transferase n=1 Tax=Heracleum sosnowskyi TaxID=360622 RepID=A0AAD8HQU4_9APIA|nr:Glutathione transferase [Heracleum sosnowskyi]